MDDLQAKDVAFKEAYGAENFEARTIGGKLHKAFMADVGEEMCQAEVAHHANRCPQYFCSRPQKHVHLHKKALALPTGKKKGSQKSDEGWDDDAWNEWEDKMQWRDPKKRITKPSDLEFYESRLMYSFAEDCGLSEYLPAAATNMEQLAAASLYEFFRLVRFHGGKDPYLSWHGPDEMPIVMTSPEAKLTEGPDFSFGARWALMQHHPWRNRWEFMGMEDEQVKCKFREWIDSNKAPWYIEDQYIKENKKRLRTVNDKRSRRGGLVASSAKAEGGDALVEDEDENDGFEVGASGVTENSEDELEENTNHEDMHVLKMLYKGDVSQINRRQEQHRRGGLFSGRHTFYKNTRCTSVAQEEQSAFPAGVLNVCEDSDDDNDFVGEDKEIEQELRELRVVQNWIHQTGWDHASEQKADSGSTGEEIDLRLDWEEVARKLAQGAEGSRSKNVDVLDKHVVHSDYSLDALDPTQRVFADRVLDWGDDLVKTYKSVERDGKPRAVPKIRSWLCGSAGSGKSSTLKTIVQHLRLKFQTAGVKATVELTAYTGDAAFNIGFGANTACSSFQIFPKAQWKKELTGEKLRRLEEQWENVALLIVDEISFIGSAILRSDAPPPPTRKASLFQ